MNLRFFIPDAYRDNTRQPFWDTLCNRNYYYFQVISDHTREKSHTVVPIAARPLPTVPISELTCKRTRRIRISAVDTVRRHLHWSPIWTNTWNPPARYWTRRRTKEAALSPTWRTLLPGSYSTIANEANRHRPKQYFRRVGYQWEQRKTSYQIVIGISELWFNTVVDSWIVELFDSGIVSVRCRM